MKTNGQSYGLTPEPGLKDSTLLQRMLDSQDNLLGAVLGQQCEFIQHK